MATTSSDTAIYPHEAWCNETVDDGWIDDDTGAPTRSCVHYWDHARAWVVAEQRITPDGLEVGTPSVHIDVDSWASLTSPEEMRALADVLEAAADLVGQIEGQS